MQNTVRLVCDKEPLVDEASMLVGRAEIEGRRLPLRLLVKDLAQAYDLDELVLVTASGEILGAHDPGLVGKRDPALARRVTRGGEPIVREAPSLALEYACRHEAPGGTTVGLYAARHLGEFLEQVGEAAGMRLTYEKPPPGMLSETLPVPGLEGVTIWASRSRSPVLNALSRLDGT